jgi:hypothetical protein
MGIVGRLARSMRHVPVSGCTEALRPLGPRQVQLATTVNTGEPLPPGRAGTRRRPSVGCPGSVGCAAAMLRIPAHGVRMCGRLAPEPYHEGV